MAAAARATPRVVSRESILTNPNRVEFKYDSMEEAFPSVDAGIQPLGTTCLFLIRRPKRRSIGNLILPEDVRSTEYYNTQVGKVIALGPLCFKSTGADGSLKDWPEGPWFKPGDFVRLPKYGGDRFAVSRMVDDVEHDERGVEHAVKVKDDVIFALFRVKDVLGLITGDPLLVRAFLD